jgi:hypothetical protein
MCSAVGMYAVIIIAILTAHTPSLRAGFSKKARAAHATHIESQHPPYLIARTKKLGAFLAFPSDT